MSNDALSAAKPSNTDLSDLLAGEAAAASGHLAQALRRASRRGGSRRRRGRTGR